MPKFKKHVQEARQKYALQLLSKNNEMSDRELNRSMKAKFGYAVHSTTAKSLREEAKKQSSKVNDSWKDEKTMAAKKMKPTPKVIDLNDRTTGEDEIKDLALQMMKVMENTSIKSVNICEEGGKFSLTLGIHMIEKRKVQLEPRPEA